MTDPKVSPLQGLHIEGSHKNLVATIVRVDETTIKVWFQREITMTQMVEAMETAFTNFSMTYDDLTTLKLRWFDGTQISAQRALDLNTSLAELAAIAKMDS